MLSEPGRTEYDLNFQFLGFDVRVHPAFFLVSLLLGWQITNVEGLNTPGVGMLLGIAVVFVSILIHEVGHGLAFRYYGIPSRLVLHAMGGLAIPESGNLWSRRSRTGLNDYQQIIVSAAGPAAGLLLAAVLIVIGKLVGAGEATVWFAPVPVAGNELPIGLRIAIAMIRSGIIINVFLNLLNLVPIYPLDGGQITRCIFQIFDPWDGTRKSLILSIAAAIFGGVYLFQSGIGSGFFAFFCFYLAFQNYQMLNPGAGRW